MCGGAREGLLRSTAVHEREHLHGAQASWAVIVERPRLGAEHSKLAVGVDQEAGSSGSLDHLQQRRWGGMSMRGSKQRRWALAGFPIGNGGPLGCCVGPNWEGEGQQGTVPLG